MKPYPFLTTFVCAIGWLIVPSLSWGQGDFRPIRGSNPVASSPVYSTPLSQNPDAVLNQMSPPHWGAEGPVQQPFQQPYGPGYQLPSASNFRSSNPTISDPRIPDGMADRNRRLPPTMDQSSDSTFQPASSPQSIMTRPNQVWESAVPGKAPPAGQPSPLEISSPINGGQLSQTDQSSPRDNLAPNTTPHWTVPTHPAWNAAAPHHYPPQLNDPSAHPAPQQPNGYYAPQEPQPTVPFSSEPSMYEKGFRSLEPTYRPESWDSGLALPFEQKKSDYPPLSEILATGRYFAMAEWQFLRPQITALGGITVDSGAVRRTRTLDYEQESAPRFRAGFESRFGPGVEFEYFQFDHDSRPLTAFSSASDRVFTQVELPTIGVNSQLQSTAANQQLNTRHDLELHSLGMSFFKEFKLPKARMNGTFGWRYVSIAQTQLSRLQNSIGTEIGRLAHSTDFRGLGPRFGFEYYRPIGHTKLEFIGTFNTSLLFGNRDQIVFNTQQGYDERLGANEFIANFDIFGGAQYVRPIGENRAAYARLGVITQTWLGGGNGSQADGDFGLRGLSFAVGWNR